MTKYKFAKELMELVELSRHFGRDVEMVQSGGGNTSVKAGEGMMYVKASGITLSEVNKDSFQLINAGKVIDILSDNRLVSLKTEIRDSIVSKRMAALPENNFQKPSIEIFLHALLVNKYVIHIHPVYAGALVCSYGGKALTERLFKDKINYLWVNYRSPGYPVGILLRKGLEKYYASHNFQPGVIFLQNHGIIISGERKKDIFALAETLTNELKTYFGRLPYNITGNIKVQAGNAYMDLLAKVFKLSGITGKRFSIAGSSVINHIFTLEDFRSFFISGALYPDQVVYCGEEPLYLESDLDHKKAFLSLKKYINRYECAPKFIVFQKKLIVLAGGSPKEIKTINEMLETHLKVLLLVKGKGKPRFLTAENSNYIANWESEKYRRRLISGN